MKKYELTPDPEKKKDLLYNHSIYVNECYRIRSCSEFTTTTKETIVPGEFGGWVENEINLSHEDRCWISPDSIAIGNSRVKEDALIQHYSVIKGDATVKGTSIISYSTILGSSIIFGGKINYCEINNSLIEYDCFRMEIFNSFRCDRLRITEESMCNAESILGLIKNLDEHEKAKLFKELTEML